jgi:hypothetical protein
VQLKSSARECVDRRLKEIAFVLIRREGAVKLTAVQGVHRLREEFSSQSCLSEHRNFEGLKDCCRCAQSQENFNT